MPSYFCGALSSEISTRDAKEAARKMVEILAPLGADSLFMWSKSADYSVEYTEECGWAIAHDGEEDYRPLYSDGGPAPNRYAPRNMPTGGRYRAYVRGKLR